MEAGAEKGSNTARNVVLTAAIAGLAGLLFGYDTGVIAGALLFIKPDFHLSSFEASLVVAAVPLGAIGGAAMSGRFSDGYGRRQTIIGSATIFGVGALVSAAAGGTAVLVIARIVIGVAIGIASATAPVYISEVSPPALRGRLVSFFQLAVTIGILVAYLVGLAFTPSDGWRWMLGLGAVPALILGLGMIRMPQSPRWLVMAGRDYAARAVLQKIRAEDPEAIEQELHEIEESLSQEPAGWRELLAPAVKAALVVGVGLAVLQQVSGINTVIYYAPTIIQFTGINSDSAAIVASLGVGVINVAMTVVALRYLDRAGRVPLLVGGSAVMAAALAALGIVFSAGAGGTLGSVVAVSGLMIYVAAFAISLGPIFWLLNAEIYPLAVRSKAAGVGTMSNWLFNFIVSVTFLPLIDTAGRGATFFIYAGICVLTVWFCATRVPETKGRTLEDIEEIFRERASSGRGATPSVPSGPAPASTS
jgi:MFS transporter, SP family, galactose:H+ symporter